MNFIVQRLINVILQKGYSTTRAGIPARDLSGGALTPTLVPGVIHAIRYADKSFGLPLKFNLPQVT